MVVIQPGGGGGIGGIGGTGGTGPGWGQFRKSLPSLGGGEGGGLGTPKHDTEDKVLEHLFFMAPTKKKNHQLKLK